MNKGFTLIEIISVIAILAIIMLVIIPVVNDTITRSKTNLNENQKSSIEMAARNWGVKNLGADKAVSNYTGSVTVGELQNSGYLADKSVVDIVNKNDLKNIKVCIKYESNQFTYKYGGSC